MTKQTVTVSPEHLQFASDNAAGICPEAWAALEAAKCRSRARLR